MKQSLVEVIFYIFISLQAIDFINTKKLFLESLSKHERISRANPFGMLN